MSIFINVIGIGAIIVGLPIAGGLVLRSLVEILKHLMQFLWAIIKLLRKSKRKQAQELVLEQVKELIVNAAPVLLLIVGPRWLLGENGYDWAVQTLIGVALVIGIILAIGKIGPFTIMPEEWKDFIFGDQGPRIVIALILGGELLRAIANK
jgi:hypothetical protein